ncbi:MAG: J domain-containing protein [Acidimicrobiales bacterium]
MDVVEALEVLGLEPGCDQAEVRAAYRALIRVHHPDLAAPTDTTAATVRTARLTAAVSVLDGVLAAHGGTVPAPSPPPPPPPAAAPAPPRSSTAATEPADAAVLDEGAITIGAPPPEAYALLYEAAGRVGDVAYVDAHLGILEIIVRFEGGPSCSVVMTLQGRATHTEVFCSMESIEAAPAPSIRPVLEALVTELVTPT